MAKRRVRSIHHAETFAQGGGKIGARMILAYFENDTYDAFIHNVAPFSYQNEWLTRFKRIRRNLAYNFPMHLFAFYLVKVPSAKITNI